MEQGDDQRTSWEYLYFWRRVYGAWVCGDIPRSQISPTHAVLLATGPASPLPRRAADLFLVYTQEM